MMQSTFLLQVIEEISYSGFSKVPHNYEWKKSNYDFNKSCSLLHKTKM
jgi:hypothetical protein